MNHAIHHLTNAEAVAKVVERVVTVVLLNRQLEDRKLSMHWLKILFEICSVHCRMRYVYVPGCVYQPAFECDGVHVEFLHQPQVMVHILQTTQHLQPQRKRKAVQTCGTWITWNGKWVMARQQTSLCSQCQTSNVGFLSASIVSWDSVYWIYKMKKKKKSHQNYRFARQFIFEFHSKLWTLKMLMLWETGQSTYAIEI